MIGLAVTVVIGIALGLWMVFVAVSAPKSQPEAASGHAHEDVAGAPDGHSDAGIVPMPGLRPSQPPGHSDTGSSSDMAGMSVADMAAMAPAEAGTADAMAGMSPAEMAAMGQPTPSPSVAEPMAGMTDADMAAMADSEPATADSDRPLGAALAGFALVNLSVLIAAVVIGRRRKAHPEAGPKKEPKRGGPPSRGRAEPPPAPSTAPVPSATESAGSPS